MDQKTQAPQEISPARTPTDDPWLLTPGPLTTSPGVKAAMQHDFGSRDHTFIAVNRRMRERLVDIVHGAGTHVCVPLQGSGTFVVEAMVGTFVPRAGKLLILVNGNYGMRIARICEYLKCDHAVLETPENEPAGPARLDAALAGDNSITHVAVIHCETTTGILNPVGEIARVTASHGRSLLIDAMSCFGAIEIDTRRLPFDAIVASSNKCLEATPGLGFCIARQEALANTQGNSPSLALDLYDQWTAMEANHQWRFTPPVHTILSFDQALNEFDEEGGVEGRGARYRENCETLLAGMSKLGFQSLLQPELQAPIIVTFLTPADPNFNFEAFYNGVREKGYVIYPGKLTVADTFRIGCIGRIGKQQIEGALAAIGATLDELGVSDCAPVTPRATKTHQ